MKELIFDLAAAAFISTCAQALIPEGKLKKGAEKLIGFAALAAVLEPAVELMTRFLKGGG